MLCYSSRLVMESPLKVICLLVWQTDRPTSVRWWCIVSLHVWVLATYRIMCLLGGLQTNIILQTLNLTHSGIICPSCNPEARLNPKPNSDCNRNLTLTRAVNLNPEKMIVLNIISSLSKPCLDLHLLTLQPLTRDYTSQYTAISG